MTACSQPASTKPIEVVHVMEAYGGVETYVELAREHWQDDSIHFSFVLAHDNAFAARLRRAGHRVEIVGMPRTRTRVRELAAAYRLRRTLNRLRPDIVHLHSSQAGLIGRLAAVGLPGLATVYTPHAFYYLGKERLARRVFQVVETLLDRVSPSMLLATSPSEAVRATDDVGIPEHRVTSLLNAVEIPPHFDPRPPLAGRPLVVGLAGRLCAQKDLLTFARAVALLNTQRPGQFEFHLAGVGHYPDDDVKLAQLMSDAGLTETDLQLHAWMPRADLLTWLGRCDVVVLTSRFESFGYALAEAGARGAAALGSDVDGIRDVVWDRVTGLLFRPGDASDLARQLEEMADKPLMVQQMGAAGRGLVEERMDITSFVHQLAAFYRGVAQQSGSSPVITPATRSRVSART